MTVEERVKLQFPALFVTLVSVLIGLVLADLVSEARERMQLWPLDAHSLRTWAQLAGVASCAVASWIIYSHLGVVRHRIATLPDTIVAFLTPAPLLILTGLSGRPDSWPYFYAGGAFCVIGAWASLWHTYLALEETALARLRRLLRPTGYLSAMYVGAPSYCLAGWADQTGMLSIELEVVFAASAPVFAAFCAHRFVVDWRLAVAATSVASGEGQGAEAELRG
jgi:hypothetical protein